MAAEQNLFMSKLLQTKPIVFVLSAIAVHLLVAVVMWWEITESAVTVGDKKLQWMLAGMVFALLLFELLLFGIMAVAYGNKEKAGVMERKSLVQEILTLRKTLDENQQTIREASNKNQLLQKQLDIEKSFTKVLQQKATDDAKQIAAASEQLLANKVLLQKTRARAEVSDRYKSAFVACVSHEIHTPMHIIMGFADMLCRQGLSQERRSELTETLITHSKRFLEVFDTIMLYSKIQSGDVNITPQTFDINFLLSGINMHADLMITQSGKPLTIKFNCNFKEKKFISSYEEGLKIVLLKLIDNAIKFSESGRISVDYRMNENRLLFSVTDNGIGIPSDRYGEIFESFYQIDNTLSRHYQGLGIGLSICKGMVNMMGGNISVDSQIGGGSTFTFDIPAQLPENNADLYSDISKAVNVETFQGELLLISDVEGDVKLITELFESLGCKVHTAHSYQHAFYKFRKNRGISFVILDVNIPGATSLTVELSQIDIQVKIIFIVPEHADQSILASAPLVGRVIIHKPVTAEKVVSVVNNMLILNNKKLKPQQH